MMVNPWQWKHNHDQWNLSSIPKLLNGLLDQFPCHHGSLVLSMKDPWKKKMVHIVRPFSSHLKPLNGQYMWILNNMRAPSLLWNNQTLFVYIFHEWTKLLWIGNNESNITSSHIYSVNVYDAFLCPSQQTNESNKILIISSIKWFLIIEDMQKKGCQWTKSFNTESV